MLKKYLKSRQKVMKFLGAHVEYNGLIHVLAGIGFGILIARPIIGEHPLRWTFIFLCLSLLGYIYPVIGKK